MKTSQDRILTTHVGSLPRSDTVVALLEARENRTPFDAAAFDRAMRQAVADIVRRQVELGIDIVSDGETSKISYATYVRDRLDGFSEEGSTEMPRPHLDVRPFPDLQRKMALLTGPRRFKRVSCIGPVKVRDRAALERDLANLRAASAAAGPFDAFMNAASPGVVTSFLPNAYYPTHDAYVAAVAEAMREEYEAIVAAGFVLQVDCPDLAMSRHTGFQALSDAEFLARAAFHVEVLNHALARVPADMVRIHVCWGNYEGPHTHDIDLVKIVDIVLRANAKAISLEAANPRHEHEWALWQDVPLPDDKILLPG
ncbi:MAG TPA: epoxyalkane--coenzyme M transferase, partial [Xanthobacteraceae bacterium]